MCMCMCVWPSVFKKCVSVSVSVSVSVCGSGSETGGRPSACCRFKTHPLLVQWGPAMHVALRELRLNKDRKESVQFFSKCNVMCVSGALEHCAEGGVQPGWVQDFELQQ
jgi:hypothetical protein